MPRKSLLEILFETSSADLLQALQALTRKTGSGKFPYPKEGIMASRKASHVEVDPQVPDKPSNAKGQPLPKGLTDLKSGQKTPEEKVQAT